MKITLTHEVAMYKHRCKENIPQTESFAIIFLEDFKKHLTKTQSP